MIRRKAGTKFAHTSGPSRDHPKTSQTKIFEQKMWRKKVWRVSTECRPSVDPKSDFVAQKLPKKVRIAATVISPLALQHCRFCHLCG